MIQVTNGYKMMQQVLPLLITALLLLILVETVAAQTLNEFEIKELTSKGPIPVFTNFPDDAGIIIYSTIEGIRFESNTGGIVKVTTDEGKYILIIKTEKQFITMKLRNFFEGTLRVEKMNPREVKYYSVSRKNKDVVNEKGSLVLHSIPPGARIQADGLPKLDVVTPYTFEDIAALTYRFEITKEGYRKVDTVIAIEDRKKKEVIIPLVARFGFIEPMIPAGAALFINNKTMQYTNGEKIRLAAGRHEIIISKNDYADSNLVFTINESLEPEVKQLNVKALRARFGLLTVNAEPGGELYINGIKAEWKPGVPVKLPMGRNKIQIQKTGFDSYEEIIEIVESAEPKSITINNKGLIANFGYIELTNMKPDEIFINGKSVTVRTNNIYEVNSGKSSVRAIKKYHDPVEVTAEIEKSTPPQKIKFINTFTRQTARVTIESEPSGADIYLNERSVGVTPYSGVLDCGEYNVRLELRSFRKTESKIEVNKGNANNFKIQIDRMGKIIVTGVAGSMLYLDGKYLGGLGEYELMPGKYTLKCVYNESSMQIRTSREANFSIEGETKKIDMDLVTPYQCLQRRINFLLDESTNMNIHKKFSVVRTESVLGAAFGYLRLGGTEFPSNVLPNAGVYTYLAFLGVPFLSQKNLLVDIASYNVGFVLATQTYGTVFNANIFAGGFYERLFKYPEIIIDDTKWLYGRIGESVENKGTPEETKKTTFAKGPDFAYWMVGADINLAFFPLGTFGVGLKAGLKYCLTGRKDYYWYNSIDVDEAALNQPNFYPESAADLPNSSEKEPMFTKEITMYFGVGLWF